MIPVGGIVETNRDPNGIDMVIPGNDDAIRSIRLFVSAIADAVIAGRAEAQGGVSQNEFVEVTEIATEAVEAPVESAAGDSDQILTEGDEEPLAKEKETPTSE